MPTAMFATQTHVTIYILRDTNRKNATRARSTKRGSTDRNAIAEDFGHAGLDFHDAGLVDKIAVEIDRGGEAAPWLKAEERRAIGFGPDAEFAKALPLQADRRAAMGGVTNAGACRTIQNDGVVGEELLGKGEKFAFDRRRLWFLAQ